MEKSEIIERFGGLMKVERLACLEDESLMPNACLLEAVAPFSGYYNEVVGSTKPLYLYIILEGRYPLEKLVRATLDIKKKSGLNFDAVPGTVQLFEHTCDMIRVRNLQKFSDIRELQKLYAAEGFEFRKRIRHFTDEKGIITLRKFFYLEPLGEGMYLDKSQPHHAYFTIPRPLSFEEFQEVDKEAKYDVKILYFDAAYVWLYEDKVMKDLIRIYREDLTLEKLKAIRDRYLSIIK